MTAALRLFCLVACLPHAAALLMRPVVMRRSSVVMRIYSPQDDPCGKRAPGLWKVYPRDGDLGIIVTDYDLAPGQTQYLGLNDIDPSSQNPQVAVEQAAVQVAPDGNSVIVYAVGPNPTGWRTRPDEAWRWLNQGESQVRSLWCPTGASCLSYVYPFSSQVLQSGWKVNLDYMYPESAVFKVRATMTGDSSPFALSWHSTHDVHNTLLIAHDGLSHPVCRQVEPCSTFPPYQVGKPKEGFENGIGGAMGGQAALPYGWISGVDQQSGQTYYYNEQTGQSQWEPPL